MIGGSNEKWKQIAEAARDEEDPERLLELIKELNQALELPKGVVQGSPARARQATP